jgi:hypothetical protein
LVAEDGDILVGADNPSLAFQTITTSILDPTLCCPPDAWARHRRARPGDEIVQILRKRHAGSPGRKAAVELHTASWRILRLARLTINNVDMQLIDADPTDAFEFFPGHCDDQLVAGCAKTISSGGLRVYMPDYNGISKPLTNQE